MRLPTRSSRQIRRGASRPAARSAARLACCNVMRWLIVVVLAAAGCSSLPPLADTHPSPEQVGEAVLEAVARGDRAALAALALSEQEFRDHVWPSLPAARPKRNLPFSYVWGDLRQKSDGMLRRTLAAYGGRRYQLVGVDFAGRSDYGDYVVHREGTFRVQDAVGETHRIRMSGSMIEKDGAWKVFSYVVDD